MKITCIICPVGCRIITEIANEELTISGNKCSKGFDFAKAETESPVRSLTTTVRTVFLEMPVMPVKTSRDVPKDKMFEIISELSNIMITEKIGIGDIVAADISGTGCDIIATSNMLKEF